MATARVRHFVCILTRCRRCCGCLRQMRAAAPEQLTADRLLQLLQRGAHRLNSGHRQMSVEQLTGFLVGHFNLNSGTCCPVRGGHAHNIWKFFTHVAWCFCGCPSEDSELLHRVAMVHGAFDPAHTGTVSLQRVLLGMGQCFCPSVTMQVGTLLVGGGSLLHACAALPHQVARRRKYSSSCSTCLAMANSTTVKYVSSTPCARCMVPPVTTNPARVVCSFWRSDPAHGT